MRRATVLLIFLAECVASCDTRAPTETLATTTASASIQTAPASPAAPASPTTPATSPEDMPHGKAASSLTPRASGSGTPLLGPPSAAALEEILAAAPRRLPAPTDSEGRTRIGTPTPTPGADEPALRVDRQTPPRSRVILGDVTLAGSMSSPAIEKAARAQIYWTLVQRCRGPDGAILPPDSVALSFDLDEGGSLIPARIEATAADPRHEEAAECMRRELAGLAFRVPAGARGQTTPVQATVPSID